MIRSIRIRALHQWRQRHPYPRPQSSGSPNQRLRQPRTGATILLPPEHTGHWRSRSGWAPGPRARRGKAADHFVLESREEALLLFHFSNTQ
uniref:Uncharacterized protein n=1 Tax=Rhizophora mucronata TaxID=61149 RepID=A0A2P2P400_RHIMU